MAEFDNMLRSLPVAYRTDKWVCDLLAAIQSLDDTQREQMFDITQQLYDVGACHRGARRRTGIDRHA